MTTRTIKICPRCDRWHTLVDGMWRHTYSECKYVETATKQIPATIFHAISQVLDARECDHCGEPYAEALLDVNGVCPQCRIA